MSKVPARVLPASSAQVLLLRLENFPFAMRAPSQEVSGAEGGHSLDRREMLIEPTLTVRVQYQLVIHCLRQKALQLGEQFAIIRDEIYFFGIALVKKNVTKP